MTEDPPDQPFRLIRSSRGGEKLVEGGYLDDRQRRVGDVKHWQCERRGVCKARVLTKGMEVVKRTNEHLHGPDEQEVSCRETKIGIKRKAQETQDTSYSIVGESLLTVSEGTASKLPKMDSLKRTIQRERERVLAAPVQPATLEELNLQPEYQRTAKGDQFLLYDSSPRRRGFSSSGHSVTWTCWKRPRSGLLMEPSRRLWPLCPSVRAACTPRRT